MAALDFVMQLRDQVSPSAKSASSALSQLESKLKQERASLAALERSFKETFAASNKSGIDLKSAAQMKAAIQTKKDSISQLNTSLFQMQGASHSGGDALSSLTGIAGGLPGILLAVVGAIGALVTGLLAAGAAVAKFALFAADSKRSLVLQLQALTGSREAALALSDAMDSVAESGLVTDDTVEKMGRSLAAAGYKGKALSDALSNVATVSATAGEEAGSKVDALYAKIAAGGGKLKLAAKALAGTGLEGVLKPGIVTAEKLGQAIKTRFGDVASKQALGLTAQFNALKHNLGELFEDIKIDGFLAGLKSVTELLSQNTATGRALKTILTGVFDVFFASASHVFPLVKAVMQGVIIAALKIAIAMAPAYKAVKKFFDAGDSGLDLVAIFTLLGEVAVPLVLAGVTLLGGAVAVLAAPFAVAAGAVALVVSLFSAMYASAQRSAAALMFFAGNGIAALEAFASSAAGAAAEFISGLVSGIESGAISVVNAVKNMAKNALAGFKSTFGISSPSKVMMQQGRFIGQGAEQGLTSMAPRVGSALTAMAAPKAISAGGGGGRTTTIEVGGITITLNGVGGDPTELENKVRDGVLDAWDQIAAQLGVVV